ncbi:MAG: S6e family ribosomal protein [Conexivisphaerales archaeon]
MSDPKSRKAKKIEIKGNKSSILIGRKIDEVIDGTGIGLGKIKFRITGASDKSGIPHRHDIEGPVKKYILLSNGPGFNPTRKGERRKKLVRGNTIAEDTYQVNGVLVEGSLEVTPDA